MKKYYSLLKTEFQRQLTYRIDVYAYRIGNLIEIFALLVIWTIAFKSTDAIAGYSQNQMITYVLISWLFLQLNRNYGLYDRVAADIFEGRVSDFLIKPISYLRYIVVLSFGRASLAVLWGTAIQSMVIFAFSKYIIFNLDFARGVILVLMLAVGYFINVFMSLIIGMIAFWTQKIIGIDYTINVIMKFLSGAYFPLALLPVTFLKLNNLFPFVYTVYVPTNLYLGKIGAGEGFLSLLIGIAWVFILYAIIKVMWRKGLRVYEGVGI